MVRLVTDLSSYKHVIWDWNGTLLNDIDACIAATSEILTSVGLAPITVEHYRSIFGFPVSEYYKKLGFNDTPKPLTFEEGSKLFNLKYSEHVKQCELFEGTEKLLLSLKEQGKLVSILSASEEKFLLSELKAREIEHLFDFVHGLGDQFARSKVDRGHELIARANVSLTETILIGDTDHDHEVAEALGIDVLLVTGGHQSLDRLHQTSRRIFSR